MLVTKCNRVTTQLADCVGRVNEFHVQLEEGSNFFKHLYCQFLNTITAILIKL